MPKALRSKTLATFRMVSIDTADEAGKQGYTSRSECCYSKSCVQRPQDRECCNVDDERVAQSE